MALQEKIIACGASLTMFGMILRFVGARTTMSIGSFAVGLRGDVFRVSIIQVYNYPNLHAIRNLYI